MQRKLFDRRPKDRRSGLLGAEARESAVCAPRHQVFSRYEKLVAAGWPPRVHRCSNLDLSQLFVNKLPCCGENLASDLCKVIRGGFAKEFSGGVVI